MVELIVTEKPAQAEKIATALADTKPIKKTVGKVKYYELKHKGKSILVGCAVGHLFGLAKSKKGTNKLPNFDIEWKPKYEIDKHAEYTRNYANILKQLSKRADKFTVATDYDVEGSVIGFNVIKFICGQKDAKRMKFSTLTKDELIDSYEKANKHLDFPRIEAGKTRHKLDWYYGINISNALTQAIKKGAKRFRLMSTGRVQGPTLKLIVKREESIKKFKPKKYWEIFLEGELNKKKILAKHKKDKFQKKEEVTKILKNTKGKKAIVSKITKRITTVNPPTPFDLTTLQIEAFRALRITPKETSKLAQDLYTAGLISYPRTSSQKLPIAINYKKILKQLSKNKDFSKSCELLLSKSKLKPNEGKKDDPAHPAVYPTGERGKVSGRSKLLYELIVRRFFAVFGDPARKESTNVKIDVNKEEFSFSGSIIVEKGWYELYGRFVDTKEIIIKNINEGDEVKKPKINDEEKETQPPKRYTQASIIKEMESLRLGTKSTRAIIVDALSQRRYIDGIRLEATPIGMALIKNLEKYAPEILDEKLTREFEEDMEKIMDNKHSEEKILAKARKVLTTIINKFKKNELEIGKALAKATKDENLIGKCPNCEKGKLMIRFGKFGRFIACNGYPKCKTIYSLPSALVKAHDELCKECGKPQLKIIKKGKKPQILCIDPSCKTKIGHLSKEKLKEMKAIDSGKLKKKCPNCKEGHLKVRKSIYGLFISCDGYPRCRYIENDRPTKKKTKS